MANKKNQHFVPQFYLRRFCGGGKLWVYDKEKRKFWHQNPSEVAKKAHYYSVEGADGTLTVGVEDLLGIIEVKTHDVFAKIDSGEQLDNIDKSTLARFIGYQMVRVPHFRRLCNDIAESLIDEDTKLSFGDIEHARESLIEIGTSQSRITDEHLSELVKFTNEIRYNITVDKSLSIEKILQLGETLGKLFHGLRWRINVVTKDDAFITSDNPLTIVGPPTDGADCGVGVLTPGALKLFPLSSDFCLVMSDKGDRIVRKPLQSELVGWMNSCTARNATRFLIAQDKDVLAETIKEAVL